MKPQRRSYRYQAWRDRAAQHLCESGCQANDIPSQNVTNASELTIAAHSDAVSGAEPDADELPEIMAFPFTCCVLVASQDIAALNTTDHKTTAGQSALMCCVTHLLSSQQSSCRTLPGSRPGREEGFFGWGCNGSTLMSKWSASSRAPSRA